MCYDFYINVYLEIHHKNGISFYEVNTLRGYYCDLDCGVYDSDDDEKDYYYNSPEYSKLYDDMKQLALTPRKPLVIYDNNSFITPKFEIKYLSIIQDKINNKNIEEYSRYADTGTFTSMDEVIKVIKKEVRYDPCDNSESD
jgi:hypothetical protein